MGEVKLVLLAGVTGSGKSWMVGDGKTRKNDPDIKEQLRRHNRERKKAVEGVVLFDYDTLMYESMLTAFPYFEGDRYTKEVWDNTMKWIDASSAMLRTIRNRVRYIDDVKACRDKESTRRILFYGYQFCHRHWTEVAISIVRELTDADCVEPDCIELRPPAHVVLGFCERRGSRHDMGIDLTQVEKRYTKQRELMAENICFKVFDDVDVAFREIQVLLDI